MANFISPSPSSLGLGRLAELITDVTVAMMWDRVFLKGWLFSRGL